MFQKKWKLNWIVTPQKKHNFCLETVGYAPQKSPEVQIHSLALIQFRVGHGWYPLDSAWLHSIFWIFGLVVPAQSGRCGVNRLHANNWPASNDSMVHLWGADDYHQFSSRYTITEMSSCSSVASHKNDVTGLLACVASMIQPTLMWHSNEIENYWNWVELSRVGGNGKAAIAWEPGYTLDRPQICWSAKTKINLKLFSKKIKNKNNQNLPTIKT